MKILFHHRIASKDGQYVHMSELIKALCKDGHDVIVIGPRIVREVEYGGEGGLVSWLRRHIPATVYELLEFGYNLPAFVRVIRAIHKHRPDIIYERYNLNFISGLLAAKLYGIPLLLEVNAPLYYERKKYGGLACKSMARWSERYVWKGATHVFPVTNVLSEHVIEAGVTPERITVIHNGIDEEEWRGIESRKDAKRRLGLDGKLILGFTGFVREWHGLERVVDLLCEDNGRNDLHLLIVGDGPARQAIETRALEKNVSDRITITGYVDHSRVKEYVMAFDIAMQPDVVEYASPLKLFEYMAAGCAILSVDRKNIREIVRPDKEAILFPHGSTDKFNEALYRLCNDSELRKRIGSAAQKRLTEAGFTWTSNARRIVAKANEIMESNEKS